MSRRNPKAVRYPLGRHHRDAIRSRTGLPLERISLEAALGGELEPLDLGIHADTLRMQAEVAEAAGRLQLARNFRRAAELTEIPDERLLAIYEALRPRRSTYYELLALSEELAHEYGAAETAGYIREAAEAYRQSGLVSPEGG